MTGNVGTHMYMVCSYLALTQQSPEVLYNRPYTEKCDVYSFGIILYELFFEEKPYDEPANNLFMLGIEITQGKRPSIRYSSTMSSREKEFLILTQQCWDQNANDRPDFAQILKKLEEL
jgi:mitogen-activated protein kinase kinase kinase 7